MIRHLFFLVLIHSNLLLPSNIFFFFNDTATTEIYTLSLHDALPICLDQVIEIGPMSGKSNVLFWLEKHHIAADRSEEHTSELQSQSNLVCRLLLEKK